MPSRRTTFGLVALVVALAAGVLGWGVLIRHHPVMPGIAGCKYLGDFDKRMDCVADRTVAKARSKGIVPSVIEAQQATDESTAIETVCHPAMHEVGNRLYTPRTLERDFRLLSDVKGPCGDGVMHGLVIQALESGSKEEVSHVADFCRTGDMPNTSAQAECFHSLGHGLTPRDRTVNLEGPLERCDSLRAGDQLVECYNGVFMQRAMYDVDWLAKGGDIVWPCKQMAAGLRAETCYSYLPQRANFAGREPPGWAKLCADATGQNRDVCNSGIGFLLARGREYECRAIIEDEGYLQCMAGYFYSHVVKGTLTWEGAAKSCRSGPKERAKTCATAIGMMANIRDRQESTKVEECSELRSDTLEVACRSGADRAQKLDGGSKLQTGLG